MVIFGLVKQFKKPVTAANKRKRNESLSLFMQLLRLTHQFPVDRQKKYRQEIVSSFKKCKNEKNPKIVNKNIVAAKDGLVNLSKELMNYKFELQQQSDTTNK